MKKRLLTVLMILMLLFAMMPMQAFAEKPEAEEGLKYLNIGDSIAFGLSADPGMSYFELYADYLDGEKFGLDPVWPAPILPLTGGAVNLGLPGLDSIELLKALNGQFEVSMTDPHYLLQVQLLTLTPQADVITISIGGNNLLTPVIEATFSMYPGVDDEIELMAAIMGYGEDVWNTNLNLFTMSGLSSEADTLGELLETRTAQFLEDWPAILDKIEDLNPDAQIVAMTLYNPIEKADNEALFNRYEALVRPMNMAMRMTQNRAALANVANAFRKEPDAVAFRLTWMDAIPQMPPVLIDPHPTTLGHQLIFEELVKVRNPRSF